MARLFLKSFRRCIKPRPAWLAGDPKKHGKKEVEEKQPACCLVIPKKRKQGQKTYIRKKKTFFVFLPYIARQPGRQKGKLYILSFIYCKRYFVKRLTLK
ncbi:hypothetical protein LOB47_10205 [Lactobacillus delbrueckii subsp. lactis]|uniref:hypothetical protein n=1 Tax=Lactobacillus delbrueckii TaxID=1584 RepID=UPI001E34520F|nr:hypothetical protein [Lactobacillus delbrueckii]MCD5607078.1 hypothetical protein [Lactobacillus delbrueckii subsp. lactis]